jgi:predicted HTH transcriptional regulator
MPFTKKYRYDDYKLWAKQALKVQNVKKRYITCAEAAELFGLASRSSAQDRLDLLVSKGLAERTLEGNKYHYHIKAEQ